MNLYELDEEMLALIDEDGVITDYELFEKLCNEKNERVQNIALAVMEHERNMESIDAEIGRLKVLKGKELSKANKLKEFLKSYLGVEAKYKTPLVSISFRKGESVEVSDINLIPESLTKVKVDVSADKIALKKYMKEKGLTKMAGAEIITSYNINID